MLCYSKVGVRTQEKSTGFVQASAGYKQKLLQVRPMAYAYIEGVLNGC